MRIFALALFILFAFIPLTVFSEGVTPEQIEAAKKAREMGMKMGMDKVDTEKMVLMTFKMGNLERKPTTQEINAMKCVLEKANYIQFQAPIEEFARYLHDIEYERKLDEISYKECGMHAVKTFQRNKDKGGK